MSTKTKILVFKMKEIIYTIVFAVLAILLIIFLVLIIKGHSKKSSESAKKSTFSPGIYEASIVLSSNPVNIEVVVDHEQIKSISMVNVSEAVTTMYPLISSSLTEIASQIVQNNSTENLVFNDENKYTSIILVNAINTALYKAGL